MDVQIGPANTTGLDLYQDIVVTELWERNLNDSVFFWLGVSVIVRVSFNVLIDVPFQVVKGWKCV